MQDRRQLTAPDVGKMPGVRAPEPAWTPILTGSQRERALQIVASIAGDLQSRYGGLVDDTVPDAWTLAGGRSGVAVLFAYLGEALGDGDARLMATHLVEDAVESAAGATKTAGLFGGFTGVAWTLAHLDGWLLDFTDGDPMEAVDSAEEAVALVVNGFVKDVLQQLPMEFAVEAQKLISISLEGSVG